jgi:hypothetical protein
MAQHIHWHIVATHGLLHATERLRHAVRKAWSDSRHLHHHHVRWNHSRALGPHWRGACEAMGARKAGIQCCRGRWCMRSCSACARLRVFPPVRIFSGHVLRRTHNASPRALEASWCPVSAIAAGGGGIGRAAGVGGEGGTAMQRCSGRRRRRNRLNCSARNRFQKTTHPSVRGAIHTFCDVYTAETETQNR